MVVAVVDEVIGDSVSMLGIELLEQALGGFLLLLLELGDQALGLHLPETAHLAQVEIRREGFEGFHLVRANRYLARLPIRSVDGDIDPVVANPFLRWHGHFVIALMLGHLSMTFVNVGVGESGSRDAHRGPAPCGAHGVVGATGTDAQGCALLADVPTNPGKDLDRSSKTEKAHGSQCEFTSAPYTLGTDNYRRINGIGISGAGW